MFNFYVALAGHDKLTDAGMVTTCWRNFKVPSVPTKSIRKEEPPKNMDFNVKKFEDFRPKKKLKYISSVDKTTP